jgi:hypothetical protein
MEKDWPKLSSSPKISSCSRICFLAPVQPHCFVHQQFAGPQIILYKAAKMG